MLYYDVRIEISVLFAFYSFKNLVKLDSRIQILASFLSQMTSKVQHAEVQRKEARSLFNATNINAVRIIVCLKTTRLLFICIAGQLLIRSDLQLSSDNSKDMLFSQNNAIRLHKKNAR